MKNLLLLIFFSTIQLLAIAQINKDSLWGIWYDENQLDTNRLSALDYMLKNYYLDNYLDSSLYIAYLQHDGALSSNNKKWIITFLYIYRIFEDSNIFFM